MKKQPLLTGFPKTLIANSKRKHQAEVRRLRESLRNESLCGYAVMFADVLPTEFLHEIDRTQRNRHFGFQPVFWAWFAQIVEGNASCSKSVALIQSWCRSQGLPIPSSDTSSYCKGRQRLDESFLDAIAGRVGSYLETRTRDVDLWHGMTLKAIDGSSVKLTDTNQNQLKFPQPSVQKRGCGFPVMSVAGLINLSHGGWEAMTTGPVYEHDLAMARRMLTHIHADDLILGDRMYCSYRFFAEVRERGAHLLTRLHQAREVKLDWRKGRKISPHERLVTWTRPTFSAAQNTMTREQWEALPESMEVRLIRLGYEDRTGRRRTMTVATTLTDAEAHNGGELHALYARRWEIELRLRDIKTSLGFELLNVKTPEMARKTMIMLRIAYNLMRVLMQRAASEREVPVGAMSFKESIDLVTSIHESFRNLSRKPRKRASLMTFLIEMLAHRVLDHRPGRTEPRAIKKRPKPFPLLTAPRHEFIEIPHRSNYRACA